MKAIFSYLHLSEFSLMYLLMCHINLFPIINIVSYITNADKCLRTGNFFIKHNLSLLSKS